jgi:glutamate synthase domain-containing protein 2
MKHKIGESCVEARNCYNNNCVDGVCTRKKRKYKKKLGSECVDVAERREPPKEDVLGKLGKTRLVPHASRRLTASIKIV